MLVQRDANEYGLPLFGRDFGRDIFAWVRRDYELEARRGAAPLRPERLEDGREGFELWGRRSDAPTH